MSAGIAINQNQSHQSVTWTDPLRLFRTRLSEKPYDPSRRVTPFPYPGEFARSSSLPTAAGPNAVHAAFTGGLPDATPPQREEAQPTKTTVTNN